MKRGTWCTDGSHGWRCGCRAPWTHAITEDCDACGSSRPDGPPPWGSVVEQELLSIMRRERDGARAECDRLTRERDEARATEATLRAEYRAMCASLQIECDRTAGEIKRLTQERDSLIGDNRRLRRKCNRLRRKWHAARALAHDDSIERIARDIGAATDSLWWSQKRGEEFLNLESTLRAAGSLWAFSEEPWRTWGRRYAAVVARGKAK